MPCPSTGPTIDLIDFVRFSVPTYATNNDNVNYGQLGARPKTGSLISTPGNPLAASDSDQITNQSATYENIEEIHQAKKGSTVSDR